MVTTRAPCIRSGSCCVTYYTKNEKNLLKYDEGSLKNSSLLCLLFLPTPLFWRELKSSCVDMDKEGLVEYCFILFIFCVNMYLVSEKVDLLILFYI